MRRVLRQFAAQGDHSPPRRADSVLLRVLWPVGVRASAFRWEMPYASPPLCMAIRQVSWTSKQLRADAPVLSHEIRRKPRVTHAGIGQRIGLRASTTRPPEATLCQNSRRGIFV